MAIKRYPLRYVRKYEYTNPESGEVEEIVFMANGYLFPLFKSLAGVELETALADYKKSLLGIINPATVDFIGKYDAAQTAEAKINAIKENPTALGQALSIAYKAINTNESGLSLVELLLIVTRVCALPEGEHSEALAAGMELLPMEIYQDPMLAFQILELAMQYDENAKKNCTFQARIKTSN